MQRSRLPRAVRPATRRRGERGAAAVEFALILPLLLMLVFGILDFGLYINGLSRVNNAARDAAREGSLGSKVSDIVATANADLGPLKGDSTVSVSCQKSAGGACGAYDANARSGDTVVVTITYNHRVITPVSIFVGSTLNGERSVRMRIE